jgi:Flp pilus assembly protein TadD
MKAIRMMGAALSLAACLTLASCGKTNDQSEGSTGSGSATETTPNDSSGAESTKAMGVGEDNQNEELGYPANQSNLNADSTRNKHVDSVKAGPKQ